MTIEIITEGGTVTVVEKALTIVYVKTCPYGVPHEFKTPNPVKVFCTDSHRVSYCQRQSEKINAYR